MRRYRYVVVDVFTDRALTGNPLAVFTDARGLTDDELQALARELHLSETVFVLPKTLDGHARLRIFTPQVEVPFAGHPTLGAAFVLGTSVQLDELRLETGRGVVPVRLEREGARVVFGWMSQPLPTEVPFEPVPRLLAALGVETTAAPVVAYDNGVPHVLVPLSSREAVAALTPDFGALERLTAGCVSAFAGDGLAWKTRAFAPAAGVPEDPATGSAAGPLALYLARLGRVPYGKRLELEQGAELGRPSRLSARVEGSAAGVTRIEVGGGAVVVARGEFQL
jgi:trans-2,3-dihydro-3-hydroxyanthranilate isomerase